MKNIYLVPSLLKQKKNWKPSYYVRINFAQKKNKGAVMVAIGAHNSAYTVKRETKQKSSYYCFSLTKFRFASFVKMKKKNKAKLRSKLMGWFICIFLTSCFGFVAFNHSWRKNCTLEKNYIHLTFASFFFCNNATTAKLQKRACLFIGGQTAMQKWLCSMPTTKTTILTSKEFLYRCLKNRIYF